MAEKPRASYSDGQDGTLRYSLTPEDCTAHVDCENETNDLRRKTFVESLLEEKDINEKQNLQLYFLK